MGHFAWFLAAGGADPQRAAEATRQWAALLLGMLLLAIVLVGLLVLLMLAKRHWGPRSEGSKKSVVIADAWAEAGKRAATPRARDPGAEDADGLGEDSGDDEDR